ncbi:hypothetical protein PC9H_005444 [Pleurotus ostreatus]|uniref:D-lactate dehydratase n=1 Tax=Pleurotus ostreatus TaxID=5322 RepID=A0A8H6ZX42_PLEOS|nr:uncharacterized protein PC9H_005444 [Pleurotus ostreatus]KAF7433490.1 hypothetical protein PC9H_005444 [Pleurotus ostreatus]KAJ8697802.1 hypothetical protein PTI98_004572 [Pleurotus ostreatus]
MSQKRVLFVFTSASKTLLGEGTGWYLPEAAHPYYIIAPQHIVDFAAPEGPNPPIDEGSVAAWKEDKECAKFLNDPAVQNKLATAKKLSEVSVGDYDAIFYVGGHGPVIDLATDPVNAKLASGFWQADKIVGAVCHGTAALVGAVDASGKSIFVGKKFTGFSNKEEQIVNKVAAIPFLLETKITELGGIYEKASEPWGVQVSVDGKLLTGQNPASAGPLGEELLKVLSA